MTAVERSWIFVPRILPLLSDVFGLAVTEALKRISAVPVEG